MKLVSDGKGGEWLVLTTLGSTDAESARIDYKHELSTKKNILKHKLEDVEMQEKHLNDFTILDREEKESSFISHYYFKKPKNLNKFIKNIKGN